MNIRIFFSSPGDVKMERETAKRIVDRLQSEIGGGAVIEPYFWEHEVMVATKDYQENIPQMDDFDIVVCILWSRLGTPLDPARHPRPGGGGFASGTEYEFFTAMQAHEVRGTPDIFVFRNTTEPRRPSRPKEAREAVDREIDRLDSFFDSYFQDNQFFTRAINIYSTLGEFEEKLTIALRSYITGRIPNIPSKQAKKPKYDRQPYLGLSAFNYEDAPVFFGRTAQVGEIITAYQAQELESHSASDAPPKHFVLILGSSGSGKSSLARAGVLPMLTNPGVIEGANAWRTAIFKPADVPGDPILALVQSLADARALPELFADGTTPREIADLIRTQPQGGGLLLRQALTQAGALALTKQKHELGEKLALLISEHREEDAKALRERIDHLTPPSVRIALLADQLEELFTSDLSPETLATFVGILIALANSGRVFVLATLRSDFYPRCLEHPDLIALMQGNGTYALPAPSATDIGQMIRQPAAIAGLTFEENPSTGEKLDELLRDAALKDPAALPLLSYTLEQLYERREDDGTLTLKAYHDLGGLEGAIGTRAETVFTSLPANAQAAFDGLCKQLVTLCEGGEPTRRRASYGTLTRTPEAKTLLDALITARLLSADQSPSGERVVSVAHEALLRHWPRLVSWVEENRMFLNTRTRVASRMADWVEKNKADEYLIPRGPTLSAAESILAGHLASLDALEIEFIGRSAEKVRREDQRKLRNARLITAGAVVLCLIAVAGGLFAMAAKRQAQEERNAAIEQEKLANKATVKAVNAEARSAYLLGLEQLESGKSAQGLTYLAQALSIKPNQPGALSRIYSELLYSPPRPIPIRSVVASSEMRQRISGCISEGLQYITYIAPDQSPEVFDLKSMKVVPGPWTKGKATVAAALTQYSDFLLDIQSVGGSYEIRCWDIRAMSGGKPIGITLSEFLSMSITADGKAIIIAYTDGNVRLLDSRTGKELRSWKQTGTSAFVTQIPGKYVISVYTDQIVIHDLKTGKNREIEKDGYDFWDAKGCAESDLFVVQSFKQTDKGVSNRFQFYDTNTGERVPGSREILVNDYVTEFHPAADGSRIAVCISQKPPRIHDAMDSGADVIFPQGLSAVKAVFSPDGRHLVTSTEQGTVNIVDIRTRQAVFSPIPHEARLEDLHVTWNGQYLLTSSGTTATVWDLSVGTGLVQPIRFPDTASTVRMTGGKLVIQTQKSIHTFDTESLTKHPEVTTLAYIDPLFDAGITRSAAMLGQGKVKIYDSSKWGEKETPLSEWHSPANAVMMSAFSPDGSLFLATAENRCWVVSTADGSLKGEYELPKVPNYNPLVSRDNRFVLNVMPLDGNLWEYSIHVWDIEQAEEKALVFREGAATGIRRPVVTISPDGRWLAAASESTGGSSVGMTYLWDLGNLSLPARELPNLSTVRQIEFSPDGSFVAIATYSRGIQVWSLDDFSLLSPTLMPAGGTLSTIEISPDSSLIAVSVSDLVDTSDDAEIPADIPSTVSVWDWREARPVSKTIRIPTGVPYLRFGVEGRLLFGIHPRPGRTDESIVQAWEIVPPDDIASGLLHLAEAASGLSVGTEGLPTPQHPFVAWEAFRKKSPGSWFLSPPESRTISPAFAVDSMRWIKDEFIGIDELLAAMPCVPLANAAITHWRQSHLTRLANEIVKLESGSPEYKLRSEQMEELSETILSLRLIAGRNTDDHPLMPYYLALHAHGLGDLPSYRKYALLAYERNPDNLECMDLAASVHEESGRFDTALPLLRKALELAPEKVGFRFRLGTALWVTGEKTAAQAEFAKAIESEKVSGLERGIMLVYLGRGAEALPVFEKIAEDRKAASPDKKHTLDSLVYLITGHLAAGDKETASRFFGQLVTAAPGAEDADSIRNTGLPPLLIESLLTALEIHQAKKPSTETETPE